MMKNKTKKLIVLVGLILVGLVTAEIVIEINKNITIDKELRDELILLNLTDYKVADYNKGNNVTQRCLYKFDAIDKCHTFNQTTIKEMDAWEKETIENIARVSIERRSRVTEKIREGTTTIK